MNTIAPYLLTRRLLPLLGSEGRVVNVSSTAQAPVDLRAFAGRVPLSHGEAHAQSKLALTQWWRHLALGLGAWACPTSTVSRAPMAPRHRPGATRRSAALSTSA